MAHETRMVAGEVVVTRSAMYGGGFVYEAWEPSGPFGGHSTITTLRGEKWYGSIASRRLPPELEALPARSEERFTRVRAWRLAQETIARAFIRAAFEVPVGAVDDGSGRIVAER